VVVQEPKHEPGAYAASPQPSDKVLDRINVAKDGPGSVTTASKMLDISFEHHPKRILADALTHT
jgi:hypothetical protein